MVRSRSICLAVPAGVPGSQKSRTCAALIQVQGWQKIIPNVIILSNTPLNVFDVLKLSESLFHGLFPRFYVLTFFYKFNYYSETWITSVNRYWLTITISNRISDARYKIIWRKISHFTPQCVQPVTSDNVLDSRVTFELNLVRFLHMKRYFYDNTSLMQSRHEKEIL